MSHCSTIQKSTNVSVKNFNMNIYFSSNYLDQNYLSCVSTRVLDEVSTMSHCTQKMKPAISQREISIWTLIILIPITVVLFASSNFKRSIKDNVESLIKHNWELHKVSGTIKKSSGKSHLSSTMISEIFSIDIFFLTDSTHTVYSPT